MAAAYRAYMLASQAGQCPTVSPPAMALNYVGVAAINFVAALLSIPVIAAGVWLSMQAGSECVPVLQWPVIALGVAVLAVGVAGSVGAFWRLPWLLLAYLVAMPVLVAALAGLAVFAFVATRGASDRPAPGRAYVESDLGDYSGWLRGRLDAPGRWDRVKTCIAATPACSDLNQTYAAATAQDFFAAARLSPLQSGCCKPPARCGYTFVTPNYWIGPVDEGADADCATWSNELAKYCYSCNSCKAGLLQSLRQEWHRVDLVVAVDTAALLGVYAMGCYAFRAAKTDELFRRYRQGYT